MLVKNWMSKNVIFVDANDSMHDAMKLMKENKIRMLCIPKIFFPAWMERLVLNLKAHAC